MPYAAATSSRVMPAAAPFLATLSMKALAFFCSSALLRLAYAAAVVRLDVGTARTHEEKSL